MKNKVISKYNKRMNLNYMKEVIKRQYREGSEFVFPMYDEYVKAGGKSTFEGIVRTERKYMPEHKIDFIESFRKYDRYKHIK